MTSGNSRNQWSELDELSVVQAMLADRYSEHWSKCREFVRDCIEKQFHSLSPQHKDDAAQEAMIVVYKKLYTFRNESKLTYWLASVAYHCTIDMLRKQKKPTSLETNQSDLPESLGSEVETSAKTISRTLEETVLMHERMQELLVDFEEFTRSQRKYERNRQILPMLFRGSNYKEIASELGVAPAVINSVIYAFREYRRKKESS